MRRVLWGVTMTLALALASGVGPAEAAQAQEAALASGVGLTETARVRAAAALASSVGPAEAAQALASGVGLTETARAQEAASGVGPAAAQAQEAARSDASRMPSERIDLNAATSVELETLPGVGPRTAERILEYRREHGRFERIEDLMDVRGIGERTFLRLRPLVTVAAPEPDADQRP